MGSQESPSVDCCPLKGFHLDIILMILYVSVVLGVLVFIHEGAHFLAARAFGVRVTEFMIGFPGPSLSFRRGETRFGVTCVPLGGYAKICGMTPGDLNPHLKPALAAMYQRGTAYMEDIAHDCNITNDEAYDALSALEEWGCLTGPKKQDEYNTFRTVSVHPTKRQIKQAARKGLPVPQAYEEGTPRPFESADALFEHEYHQQYCSLSFWKRSVILLAGIAMNLLFAIVVIVLIYSVIGIDYTYESGEVVHLNVPLLNSLYAGLSYIAMVAQAIVSLFNPATAAQTVSDSTSIIGIAVFAKVAADEGVTMFLQFMAMISVSLGLMNLLPIPPLDGGRFVIEIYEYSYHCGHGIFHWSICDYDGPRHFALCIWKLVMICKRVKHEAL